MRAVDALDGKLKPIWGVVEAGPPKGLYPLGISPEEIQGAVVSELIHGANGIVYFNHIFQPPCISYHFLRDSPSCTARHPRAKNIVPAVKEVNRLIEKLAPVLNSPSYVWTFNPQLDTRLSYGPDGAAYVFAQQRSADSGSYDLTLPDDLAKATEAVNVVDGKTVPISNGRLRADFAHEYSWHIWKISGVPAPASAPQ
jgi:hypothetical protein